MTAPDLPVVLDFSLGGLAILALVVPIVRRRRESALRQADTAISLTERPAAK